YSEGRGVAHRSSAYASADRRSRGLAGPARRAWHRAASHTSCRSTQRAYDAKDAEETPEAERRHSRRGRSARDRRARIAERANPDEDRQAFGSRQVDALDVATAEAAVDGGDPPGHQVLRDGSEVVTA